MGDIDETFRHYNNDHEPHSNIYADENTTLSCRHKSGPEVRNLVVCIDGTANQFGEKNTNVIEFYNLIEKEVGSNQLTWYNSGIGTYARPSWKSLKYRLQVLDHIVDLAIAWNFERTILAAYRWLSDNYQEDDRLFLFGFSRGAFQVRVLAAMIDKVGLIHKGNEEQIPFAYQLYSDSKSGVPKGMAERFKTTFSHSKAAVHYVGVWDTVSSIGIGREIDMFPGTVDGMRHVCYFRHALALDERRVKFAPEYAYGGSATSPPESSVPSETAQSTRIMEGYTAPHTLEVWFAGTHSDIGGGNVPNMALDRSAPPLLWMVFESSAAGLRTKPFQRFISPYQDFISSRAPDITVNESLTVGWWILECLPLPRLTYTRKKKGKQTTLTPHIGKARKIHEGQKIHGSVMGTNKKFEYTPKARPLDNDPAFWIHSRAKGLGDWKASDLFEDTQGHVNRFLDQEDESVWDILRRTAMSFIGRQAVYEGMLDALQSHHSAKNEVALSTKVKLIAKITDILDQTERKESPLRTFDLEYVKRAFEEYRESNDQRSIAIAQAFLRRFTTFKPQRELVGHKWAIPNVAVFPNKMRIVSGLSDCTIRSWGWDAAAGTAMRDYSPRGTSVINIVVVSPSGKRIVSGTKAGNLGVWNADFGILVGGPLVGHTKSVRSLAISPDGKWVASGSEDKSVRIWNVHQRTQVSEPLRGHGSTVCAVGFSADGRQIVSCSIDKTVRVWDRETQRPAAEPFNLEGDQDRLLSAALSSDGSLVAAGFSDETVGVWDLEQRTMIGKPFRLHGAPVCAVAFSPDGRRIISGSSDGTVLIWDVETQKPENTFQHRNGVQSVAFFPDGENVVTGCNDGIIRIWRTGPW